MNFPFRIKFLSHDPFKHVIQILRRLDFDKRKCRETHSRKITVMTSLREYYARIVQVEFNVLNKWWDTAVTMFGVALASLLISKCI